VNESDVDLEVALLCEGSVGTQVTVIHTVLFLPPAAVHGCTVCHHVDLQVGFHRKMSVRAHRTLESLATVHHFLVPV
jgi:hypothetical protein